MEPEDEEEYQYDSRTPVGQLVQRVDKVLKKPRLDDQLSELLDKFRCYFIEQQEYLNNGICELRFSETALFIQACSKVYVKKVDLYWDEVLSFHARLIEYDVEHARKTGTQVDRTTIERLEERRNRNKRKKKYKISEDNEWLSEINNHKPDLDLLTEPCEADRGCARIWETLNRESEKYRIDHPLVREQKLKVIKFDRKVKECDDSDVYDKNGEFIMKYSKMPGWRDVYDLIEYNNQGLLPDKDNVISGLKLAYFGSIEFMRDNGIPFDTPFEEYEDKWERYKAKFLEMESKRWQNRPLDTLEDLAKQYEYLAEMVENGEEEEIFKPCNSIILPEIMEDEATEPGPSSHAVNPSSASNLDLFVVLDKLPNDVVNTKSRQDSGFFDEAPGDSIDDETNEISDSNVPNDDSTPNISNDENITEENKSQDCPESSSDTIPAIPPPSDVEPNVISDCERCLSEHNYCISPVNVTPPNDDKSSEEKSDAARTTNAMDPFQNLQRIIPIAREVIKRKLMKEDKDSLPPKARKLSKRQIEKLSRSFIKPVKELKFEKFFSINYHPQIGEGEMQPVDYESDEEDDDIPEPLATEENEPDDCPESSGSPDADPGPFDSVPGPSDSVPGPSDSVPGPSDMEQSSANLADSAFLDASESTLNESVVEAAGQETEQKELETERSEDGQKEAGIDVAKDVLLEEQKLSDDRVQAWKNHIKPIIKNLKETDFDIHEYGSRIMEGMQINEEKPFKDIVEGKSSAEFVRLFISSLQLASTSNIQICGVTQGELANDTYRVKLLKTERYHEDLEGYQAPSREVVRERRKRMIENKQSQNSNLSHDEPSVKVVRKSIQFTSVHYQNKRSTPRSHQIPETRRHSNSSGFISPILSPIEDTEDEGFNESFSSSTSMNWHSTPKAMKRVRVGEKPEVLNFQFVNQGK